MAHNSAPRQATELRICMRGSLDEFHDWGASSGLEKLHNLLKKHFVRMCFLDLSDIFPIFPYEIGVFATNHRNQNRNCHVAQSSQIAEMLDT